MLDIGDQTVTLQFSSHVRDQAATASIEWKLLLAGAAALDGEDALARMRATLEAQSSKTSIHWDNLLQLAERHGISNLLYRNLKCLGEVVSAAVLEALLRSYERNVHKSLLQARDLMVVLDCADALGIELIPYKGLVLSEVYYGDMAMRQCGDIDLFVRECELKRIKEAVRQLGYTPRLAIPSEAEKNYAASGYECTFDSPAGKNLLELQWALQPHFYAVDFDMDGLFERAVEVMVGGRKVKTLSPEDLLLVLSVHAAKHAWGKLLWLCDIAQIVKRENLHWDIVQRRAQQFGVERILHVSLLLIERFFGTAIPFTIEKAIFASGETRKLTDQISLAIAAGVSDEGQPATYFRLMMRLRERRSDQLRFLTRLAFTPGPGEWETIRLPKTLFPVYRLVRLARLATRWV